MKLPFFGSRQIREDELDEELRSHLAMAVRDRVARGEDPVEAEYAVRREMGNLGQIREITRAQWSGEWIQRTGREVTFALRGLRRAPGFTITAGLILGLGIGMSTAMFTVFDAVLLQPIPVQQPDRVILPRTLDPNGVDVGMNQDELHTLLASSHTLSGAAGIAHQGAFANAQIDGDRVVSLRTAWVTGNFFELLGSRPALGRFFDPREEVHQNAVAGVMVLSYEAWKREFGGDSAVLGRQLSNPYTHTHATIIGVAPPGLAYPAGVESWTPQVYPILDVIARLAPGASKEAAQTEFLSVMQQIDRTRLAQGSQLVMIARADGRTLTDAMVGDVRPQLIALTIAVALLLLITCVNVGNLVLLRTTMRETEIAVRRSLGASTADIVRPLLWESAALALIGGLLGAAFSAGLLTLLTRLALPQLPRLDLLRGRTGQLALAATVTLTALLLAGVIPTLAILRGRLGQTVRSDARAGRGSAARRRMRQWLVSVQVALALIMLTGAALLVRSLDRLNHVPLGYESRHLAIITMARTVSFDSIDAQMAAMYDRLEPALLAVPGVSNLTPIAASPFYGPQVFTTRLAAEGQSEEEGKISSMTPFEVGGPDYFRTFGIPVLRGRGFLQSDRADAPRVLVVSHAIAERFWPGQNPVGKRLRMVGDTGANVWITVVGEAGDIRYRSLRLATPSAYFPWRQLFFQGTVAIRTSVPLATVLPEIRRAVRGADGEVTITHADAMDDLLAEQLAVSRLSTRLLAGFGLAALVLAAIGLYGVMAASVRERTRELGIRAALGATPGRLRREVLTQAGIIAAAGATVGLIGALATSRFLQSLLFEIHPLDPAAILGACGVLMMVALAAAYFPAWLATRADPATALRAE